MAAQVELGWSEDKNRLRQCQK